MTKRHEQKIECPICHKQVLESETSYGEASREAVWKRIAEETPGWHPEDRVCLRCLNKYRGRYIREVLEAERGELSALEMEVVRSLQEQETLSENLNTEFDENASFGERVSDRIASFGGSWTFILSFALILFTWITFNSISSKEIFDPYPYILLNLILSCLAAVQAPIIMMSQNRQETRDRLEAEHDFKVNLKAELEIRHVNLKLDQLMTHQWRRLLEIQQIQTEMMEQLLEKKREES